MSFNSLKILEFYEAVFQNLKVLENGGFCLFYQILLIIFAIYIFFYLLKFISFSLLFSPFHK